MPIVRITGQLIYFAHVPKCAGTAIERYLQIRFGPLGFRNPQHLLMPAIRRWSKSSPQHIDFDALQRLIPESFFAASFAVVRHPLDRIRSVFLYQRDIEQKLDPDTTFEDWLNALPGRMKRNRFYLDNHPRPMSDFIPDAAAVFRLEDGLDPVIAWLDDLAGDVGEPRAIERFNAYSQQLNRRKLEKGPEIQITPAVRQKVSEIYAADFKRFGYPLDEADNDRQTQAQGQGI